MDLIFLAASLSKIWWYSKEVLNYDSVGDNHLKLDDSTNCIMDTITTSPELQHISEDIFKLLDNKSLMNCRLTNSSWKNILNRPIFWLQKLETEGWESLSKLIGNRQLAQDFARELKNLESLPLDVQYKWRAISQDLEILLTYPGFALSLDNNQKNLFWFWSISTTIDKDFYPLRQLHFWKNQINMLTWWSLFLNMRILAAKWSWKWPWGSTGIIVWKMPHQFILQHFIDLLE